MSDEMQTIGVRDECDYENLRVLVAERDTLRVNFEDMKRRNKILRDENTELREQSVEREIKIQAAEAEVKEAYARGIEDQACIRRGELAEAEAEINRLKNERDHACQYRSGHLPTCNGMDIENQRCGCGYLDGYAYREIIDHNTQLQAQIRQLIAAPEGGWFAAWETADKDRPALQAELARRTLERDQWEKTLDRATDDEGELRARIAELEADISRIREMDFFPEYSAMKDERDSLRTRIAELEAGLRDLMEETANLNDGCDCCVSVFGKDTDSYKAAQKLLDGGE